MSPVPAKAEALKAEQTKADETNKGRTGKGLRVKVGQTRGKNPSVISWEAFDLEKPDTLPASLKEFMDLTKTTSEADMVAYVVDGYNASQYSQASDEIGEYINDAWDKETQAQFRLAVRNYSKIANVTIEDAVKLIKPGLEAAFLAKSAAPTA